MEALIDLVGVLGPYSIASLGAALLGFGLVSGLLLIRAPGSQFVRPYFMSAFGTALAAFVLAAMERPVLSGGVAILKALLLLVTVGYGVALVRRAWRRQLANRPLGTYVIVCVICCGLPAVPGVIGSVLAREDLIRAAASSTPEVAADLVRYASIQIWMPLVATAVGTAFLLAAFLLLLFRKAAGR
jgi:hypothetical protein